MNPTKTKELRSHEDVLEAIAEAIDIPEHLEQVARERYQSIGNWLDRDASTIKQYDPEVSPQGSFLLGTVIRPVGDADEYDIDLVCRLNATKQDLSMAELKKAVGVEIVGYATAHRMEKEPEDGRRCWTMEYADDAGFHMDILPSLPDEATYRVLMEKSGNVALATDQGIREQAIAITDKTHPKYTVRCDEWPVSNPKGYAIWFQSRQSEVVLTRKRAIMETDRVYASVDDVPDYKIKTPLQRAIQLLKRHRDTMFNGDDDRPISIIITTLSAHAYNGEQTIGEALRSILKNMHMYIEDKGGVKWVANPVNPMENFADKWLEAPQKEKNFFSWLEKARRDFGLYLTANVYSQVPTELQEALSKDTVTKVLPMIALAAPAVVSSADAGSAEAAKVIHEGGATKPWRR